MSAALGTQYSAADLAHMVRGAIELSPDQRRGVVRAFEDTVAVALAGWYEPVSVVAREYAGAPGLDPFQPTGAIRPEDHAFAHATAAHVLDYDDVDWNSITHPSAVIVPALLAVSGLGGQRSLVDAYAAGLSINFILGQILGFEHYNRGWHATATIGPVAAAAAICCYLDLDDGQTRNALALAATQSAGMQRNFGTMTKPLQAGNAAAAGVRAAMLAKAGVTADPDFLGAKGFADLYAAGQSSGVDLRGLDASSVMVKLFPCCGATHRLIGAVLAVRARLTPDQRSRVHRLALEVPFETMRPLVVADPKTGAEAKFCARYVAAVAFCKGAVGLVDFTDHAIGDRTVRAMMERVEISDDEATGRPLADLSYGEIVCTARGVDGAVLAAETCLFYPGSPEAPPTPEQLDVKIADCLASHAHAGGEALTVADFRAAIARAMDFSDAASGDVRQSA